MSYKEQPPEMRTEHDTSKIKLSVNIPFWRTCWWAAGSFFFWKLLMEQLNSYEPNWFSVFCFISVIGVWTYFMTRFWLAPAVRFNEEGVFINRWRSPEIFVPFTNVTVLRLVNNLFSNEPPSSYRQFDLFYLDEAGYERRARFILVYHRRLFSKAPPLHLFLKRAEEANEEFEFSHHPYSGPQY